MNRDNARLGLYTLAGIYLLYTAYQLFQGLDESGNVILFGCFTALFAVAGVVLLGLSVFKLGRAGGGAKEPVEESMAEEDGAEKDSTEEESTAVEDADSFGT